MLSLQSLKKHTQCTALLSCLFISAPTLAHASEDKDAGLVSKVVSFIKGGPTGTVDVAVVYDPSNTESSAHADAMIAAMSGVSGKITLNPSKVQAGAMDSANQPVIFVTKSMDSHYSIIASKGAGGTLLVSTDENCLAKACSVVVKSQPSIDILVSTDTASSAGIEFASAFSMLITKR